jgi:hypothetical protein
VTGRLPLATRVMRARNTSECPLCPYQIGIGQHIAKIPGTGWCHVTCVLQATKEPK